MSILKRHLTICAILLLCPGCVGFHYQWHHSSFTKPQENSQSMEGIWTGSWQSGQNRHNGKLRCVIRKKSADTYTFFYRATWARIITGNFKITCETNYDEGTWKFSGTKDLGILGGKFFHTGTATAKSIQAKYRSEMGDEGTFTLSRP